MSIEVIKWAKEQHCGCFYAKAVLLELANWTRPDGICEFRKVADIANIIEVSKRTVQRALDKLELSQDEGGLGLIKRVTRFRKDGGQQANCFEMVGYICPGDQQSPPQRPLVTKGGTDGQGRACPAVTPYKDLELDQNKPPLSPEGGGRKIRKSIPDDWRVPELGSLPENAKAFASRWPAGAYAAQAEAFEGYHRGTGTRRADWDALWAAWVSNKHEAVMRQGKTGVVFASPAPGSGSSPGTKPAPKRPAAAKADEDDRSGTLHATLREQIGQMLWEQWFAHTALIFADDHLTVAAPSQFVSGWLSERMAQHIDKALAHIGWHVDQIYHRVSLPEQGKSEAKAA